MASPHERGGGKGHPPCSTWSSSSSPHHDRGAAGPHLAPGEQERLATRATSGLEMMEPFQQAPAQQGPGSTFDEPARAWSGSTAGPDNVSRNFLAAGDEGGRQQIQSSSHIAVSTGVGSGIPRAELSNRPHLARGQRERSTRNTLVPPCAQRPTSHASLAAAVAASQASGAVDTIAGMPNGTEIGIPAPHVPLSSVLGQEGSPEVGNVGVAGMEAGVGAGSGQLAAWEGSGAAGGLAFSIGASMHFPAQEGAAGEVLPQQSLSAEGGALLPVGAVGGIGGCDEEEDDSDVDGASPIPEGIPIPEGVSLNKSSWCCGRKETIRSICSKCQRRWHCHIAHGLINTMTLNGLLFSVLLST